MQTENKSFTLQPNTIGLYIRLSREDGDKTESLSITNQRLLLSEYAKKLDGFTALEYYIDDGYTGTNFERPAFQRMITDIESGKIHCVIVKDLSRLGRNMPKVTQYVSDYFPSRKVRFIAIDDNVDKKFYDFDTSEDMMIDIKNMFNGFYPKDISKKVRSTFRSKQRAGQFIGAFACYGYKKSPENHNQLIVDKPAATIVQRIFNLYIKGYGQNTIAKLLNEEGLPCPSEYKKMCGLNYHNSNKLEGTHYWTYASIRNILRNQIYTGTMVQNKAFRQVCKKKAITLPKEEWIIVPNTHEAIIDKGTFDKVQDLLKRNTKQLNLHQNIHIFAGFLKCGDCGRAMSKITRNGITIFNCGSYNRYGTSYCNAHTINESVLEQIVLKDFNRILQSIHNLKQIIDEELQLNKNISIHMQTDVNIIQQEIQKLLRRKERAYEDYAEELISKAEYLKYKEKYELQISAFEKQLDSLTDTSKTNPSMCNEWTKRLLEIGYLEKLDRETVVELIDMIYIYDNHTIKIIYNFSDELETLLNG